MNGRVHKSSLAVLLNHKEKQFQELGYRPRNCWSQYERTYTKIRWRSSALFHRKHSSNASKTGGNTSSGVL